ncbi:MAG: ThuA domain-containing protein [Balneolaceae bacterium]
MMKRTLPFLLSLSLFMISCGSSEMTGQSEPMRILYVTGGGYHDYEAQEELLSREIGERLSVEWTTEFEAGSDNTVKLSRFEDPNWHEGFDAVIYNMCFAPVDDNEYIEGITSAHHETGLGAIFLHCTMHTFRDAETEEWDRFIGLDTYHHERQQREFEIIPMDTEHPVMDGFPSDGWVSPQDELYIIRDTYENLTPLSYAYGPETESDHIVMWTNTYGNARVAGTTAGHNDEVIADPVYLDFVVNSLYWVTGQ